MRPSHKQSKAFFFLPKGGTKKKVVCHSFVYIFEPRDFQAKRGKNLAGWRREEITMLGNDLFSKYIPYSGPIITSAQHIPLPS